MRHNSIPMIRFGSGAHAIKGSMNFPGTINQYYLTIPNDIDLRMGTGDFTIEFFAYYNTSLVGAYPRFFSMGAHPSASIAVDLENDGNLYFYFNSYNSGNGFILGAPEIATFQNRWSHYAFVRSSGTISGYINGTRQTNVWSDVNSSAAHTDATNVLTIGNEDVTGSTPFQAEFGGPMTNFRWTKGLALYAGPSFVTPTSPLTALSSTKLLILANNGLPFVDSSAIPKTITNVSVPWSVLTPF